MRDILTQGLQALGITPPEGAVDRLCRYGELLLEQNQVMNLTAITEPGQVARLHFLDSAAVIAWGRAGSDGRRDGSSRPTGDDDGRPGSELALSGSPTKPAALLGEGGAAERASLRACPEARDTELAPTWLFGKTLVDVGTGAGFPGMVLKILEPSLSLTLVDSLGKRLVWLESVCKVLSLDGVRCIHARAEELAMDPEFRDRFDVATSRAVAAFPALCELCLPYVRPGGVFLAMKSVESGTEVAEGQNAVNRLGGKPLEVWDYPIPGGEVTHRIVGVRKVSPTPKWLPRSWGKIKKAPL